MKKNCLGSIFLPLLIVMILGIGCSTVKSVYEVSAETAKSFKEKIGPDKKPLLKKKVLVPPIINQAKISQERVSKYTEMLVDFLKKDTFLAITETAVVKPSSLNIRSPEYGVIIDPVLISQARDLGMDVLITCTLNPFEVTEKKTGIWPFRKLKREIEISITMNAVDTSTETLLISDTEMKIIKNDEEIDEEQESRRAPAFQIPDKELSPMLKKLSERVIDRLDSQPWRGKILSVDNNSIRIDGGKDIGIIKGNDFEVFGRGEKIKSLKGKEYFFLGPKVGEIRVEEVSDDWSLAVPLNSGQFEAGLSIVIKR